MKLNITIDLNEEWGDDESTIAEMLEKKTKSEIVNQIWKKIETKVDDQINRAVRQEVEKQYTKNIAIYIDNFFTKGTLKSQYTTGKELSFEEWFKEIFERNTSWNSPKDQIEKLAKKYGEEMKNKYDLLFASQLVAKMNEQGLLKEDVVKLLLS